MDNRDEEETPEAKARERWLLLLDKLGILGTDEFEPLVVDYLKSGLIEGAAVGRIIDRYLAEGRELVARTRAKEFFQRCIWHPELTEAQLLEELQAMLPDVGLLDMRTVTSLHDEALDLGDADLGRKLVDGWLAAFRQRYQAGQEPDLGSDFDHLRSPLHPAITAEIHAVQARRQSTVTLLEVVRSIRDSSGWGSREATFMKSVTPAHYEEVILATTGADLKLLLLQSVGFFKNPGNYESHFGGAAQSFVKACREIVACMPDSRIAKLIRLVFRDSGIEAELTPAAKIAPADRDATHENG